MPLPILSVAQVRDWEERTWNTGITVESVIEQADKQSPTGYSSHAKCGFHTTAKVKE